MPDNAITGIKILIHMHVKYNEQTSSRRYQADNLICKKKYNSIL